MILVEGRLYLVARKGDGEVWVPLDESWLARHTERALVEIELREMPSVRLGAVTVSFADAAPVREAAAIVRTPGFAPDAVNPQTRGRCRATAPK